MYSCDGEERVVEGRLKYLADGLEQSRRLHQQVREGASKSNVPNTLTHLYAHHTHMRIQFSVDVVEEIIFEAIQAPRVYCINILNAHHRQVARSEERSLSVYWLRCADLSKSARAPLFQETICYICPAIAGLP